VTVDPLPLLLTGWHRLGSPLTGPDTLFDGTVGRLEIHGLNRMSQVSEPYSQSTTAPISNQGDATDKWLAGVRRPRADDRLGGRQPGDRHAER
jgi:hypothetical protein